MYAPTLRRPPGRPGARACLGLLLAALLAPGGAPPAAAEPRLGRVFVEVEADGFVAVPAAELARLGLGAVALRVRRHGREVPVWPHAPGADLVFLAEDVAGPHTRRAAFEVLAGGSAPAEGGARTLAPTPPGPEALEVAHAERVVEARDLVLGTQAAARAALYARPTPHWFAGALEPGATAPLSLAADPAEAAGAQRLVLRAARTHEGPIALELRIEPTVGEPASGGAQAPVDEGGLLHFGFQIPAEAFGRGPPRLTLVDRSPAPPPPPPRDVSEERGLLWLDTLTLAGPVHARVPARGLLGLLTEAPLALRGAAGGYAVALDAAGTARSWRRLEGTAEGAAAWCVEPPPPGGRLVVGRPAAPHGVRPATGGGSVLARVAGAQHLIVAVPALVPAAERLAAHRRAQGLASVAVDLQAVVDEFGHGEAVPAAIRRLVEARAAQAGPPLAYLLLAGDATYDRTDLTDEPTLPTPMTRSAWNGATAADRLYVEGVGATPVSVGRLPFRRAAAMEAYVERVRRYESSPPADERRRLLRFLANEARFGPLVDRWIEAQFRRILTEDIPAAYEVEVTFGAPSSPYFWPAPEWNERVIEDLNRGSLFTIYVGHGYTQGFDEVRVGAHRFRVLDVRDAPRVASPGLPPVLFVLACSTAGFDHPRAGIGEALLAQPHGPVAFWGATRICHPSWNTLVGKEIARELGRARPGTRLGPLIEAAQARVLGGEGDGALRQMIALGTAMFAPGPRFEDVLVEGARMYQVLGDPALLLALPEPDLEVAVHREPDGGLVVRVPGPFAPGALVTLALARLRDQEPALPPLPAAAAAEEQARIVRERHRRANARVLLARTLTATGAGVEWRLAPPDVPAEARVVQAAAPDGTRYRIGAALLPPPPAAPEQR